LLASRRDRARRAVPVGVAVEQLTAVVYVTSMVDNDVATFNGRARPARIRGCRPEPKPLRLGGWGVPIGLDGSSSTGYVPR
jgi:hypothetical protein